MKLTVQTQPFLQMLVMLREQGPSGADAEGGLVSLAASGERLCVKVGRARAETEAAVWEEGQCHVSARKMLRALKISPSQATLTIQTTGRQLRAGENSIPLKRQCTAPRTAGALQFFLTTDLGVVATPPGSPTGSRAWLSADLS